MAFTSGVKDASSRLDHKIRLQAKGLSNTKTLPDLPQDSYQKEKGDLWKLHLKDFFGFTTCITMYDIQYISILAGSDDGWNIESIVTFAIVNNKYWELMSGDYNVNQWIDSNSGEKRLEFVLSLTTIGPCIRYLYVMAYTSSKLFSGSDSSHRIEIQANGLTKTTILSDLPKDDYSPSKGDLWKLSIADDFKFTGCVSKKDIQGIGILAGGNNGWNINSIITYVAGNEYNWELSSVDLDVDRWIDQNSKPSYKRFQLNLVI